VITEDSDLLAFGVKKVLFKMDLTGSGIEVDMSHLDQCESFRLAPNRKSTTPQVFNQDMFLKTCILNGCDYLESVKGIGFKKALKLMKENNGDIKIIAHVLDQDKTLEIDPI
jgi:exonuclease 1